MRRRIISLVPSLTYDICELGLKNQLVGCTSFCVRPKGLLQTATTIGGTKNPDLDLIRTLNPTHILGNDEENKPEHLEACKRVAPTFSSLPRQVKDSVTLVKDVADFLDVSSAANPITAELESAFEELMMYRSKIDRTLLNFCLYFIWRQPYMVVGQDTFISRMLECLGFSNLAPSSSRYPEMTLEEINKSAANHLLLSSEPYPFRKRHGVELKTNLGIGSESRIEIAHLDGQLMSWHGSLQRQTLRQASLYLQGKPNYLVQSWTRVLR